IHAVVSRRYTRFRYRFWDGSTTKPHPWQRGFHVTGDLSDRSHSTPSTRRRVRVPLRSLVAGSPRLADATKSVIDGLATPHPEPGRRKDPMPLAWTAIIVVVLALILLALAVRIVKQYEQGVHFRLGRVIGVRQAGLTLIIPVVDVLQRVSLRIVTMPIQSQGIITRDNVSVDVSAVAYFRVVDAVKSVVAVENVQAAINQIAQTTLRKVVGQHTLDETLSETDRINLDIRSILDVATID